jgi:hypothetical protein
MFGAVDLRWETRGEDARYGFDGDGHLAASVHYSAGRGGWTAILSGRSPTGGLWPGSPAEAVVVPGGPWSTAEDAEVATEEHLDHHP